MVVRVEPVFTNTTLSYSCSVSTLSGAVGNGILADSVSSIEFVVIFTFSTNIISVPSLTIRVLINTVN